MIKITITSPNLQLEYSDDNRYPNLTDVKQIVSQVIVKFNELEDKSCKNDNSNNAIFPFQDDV